MIYGQYPYVKQLLAIHCLNMNIGERLAEARKRAGLRQVELAVAMGERYDQTVISAVENNRSRLRYEGLFRAAQELGISLDYLFGLTDDPTPAAELSERASSASGDSKPISTDLTENEQEALAIAQDLRDPLLRGWLQSGAALLESQALQASRTQATNR